MKTACKLCKKHRDLRRSHIIPEFAFKPIYDNKHRAIAFTPSDVDNKWFEQKGWRDRLLCDECEQFLNDKYERPFKEFWFDENPLAPLEGKSEDSIQIIREIDYAKFKLFHLSVLYRAAVSTHDAFRHVSLGPHEERIREMIIGESPNRFDEYAIHCNAIHGHGRVWWQFISSPYHLRVGDHHAFLFTFAGCGWVYFTTSHWTQEFSPVVLQEDGTMPVQLSEWKAFKHIWQVTRPK